MAYYANLTDAQLFDLTYNNPVLGDEARGELERRGYVFADDGKVFAPEETP